MLNHFHFPNLWKFYCSVQDLLRNHRKLWGPCCNWILLHLEISYILYKEIPVFTGLTKQTRRHGKWFCCHKEQKIYNIYNIYIFMNDIRRQDTRFGALLEVEIMKLHVVVARSTFRSQHVKAPRAQITFGSSDVASCGRSKGFCTFLKVSKTWGFCSSAKRHVHQRC